MTEHNRVRLDSLVSSARVVGPAGVGRSGVARFVLLCFVGLSGPAAAELPLPTYPDCGEPDRPDLCPPDLRESWELISYVPLSSRDTTREAEQALGSGMWVDRAWRWTTGDTRVLLALGDSGVDWGNRHIRAKFALNTDELPLPWIAESVEAPSYDANEDGIINVDDYAADPRVSASAGHPRAVDFLDPSDLLAVFSDGVDDDGNGYTDDICGWDFFGQDNDAFHTYTEGFGTHGDGVIEAFGAEGGDDDGNIGVCPNCRVMPLRVGDTFITDGVRAGEAIVYAADRGAKAMSLAIGALTNPESTTQAAAYAFSSGLTLVGAAGDENAYHHNFPAMLDNILYVHSIRHNSPDDDRNVYSWSNTWNCNNYGSRLVVVAPASACATGAVANITGMVGLIHSAAVEEGLELHAGEVYQIVIQTVDDIHLPESEREISRAYPSAEGWDGFYGYGRVNAERAVRAVKEGEIPPYAEIWTPMWFEVLDYRDHAELEIQGKVSATRSSGFEYVVEYGTGNDPRTWTELSRSSGSGSEEGVLARLDLSAIPWSPLPPPEPDEGIMERLARVNASEITVRVRVEDAEGRTGEMRKSFFLDADPDRLPGFPVWLGGSGESSPQMADMNGDGVYEIITATASGQVVVVDGSGEPLEGWPVSSDPVPGGAPTAPAHVSGAVAPFLDGFIGKVAVGDLDGDGSPEVVAASVMGGMYAWHADGSRVEGFPYHAIGREPEEFDGFHTYDQGFAAAPTLFDLDGDGLLEIIEPGADSRVYIVDSAGQDWGPYPLDICYPTLCGVEGRRIIDSIAVGDVDGDGDYELGFGTNESPNDGRNSVSYLIEADTGDPLPNWPRLEVGFVNEAVLLPLLGEGHPASMAFADLDGDGDLEISSPVMFGTNDIIHHTGEIARELSYFEEDYGDGTNTDPSMMPAFVQFSTNPSFGDVDMDGVPDHVLGGASTISLVALALQEWIDFQQPVGAWSGADGAFLTGWPRQIEDMQFLLAPAIADISGDGNNEVIYASAGYVVHAWDAEGNSPEGWPKFTGNWILGSPTVGDINGDGWLDVAVTTREGWLYAWSTRGRADQVIEWGSMLHDAANTSNHSLALPTQEGPVLDSGDSGGAPDGADPGKEGGCCSSEGGASLLILLPLGLAARRRRGA